MEQWGRRNPGPKWPHGTGCCVSLGPTIIWERKKLSFSLCPWLLGLLYHSSLAINIKFDTWKWGTSNRILKRMALHKQSDNWQWRNRFFQVGKLVILVILLLKCLVEILPSQLGSLHHSSFYGWILVEAFGKKPEYKCVMVAPCWLWQDFLRKRWAHIRNEGFVNRNRRK